MFKHFGLGVKTFFKAFGFIFKNNLWWYLFIPPILTITLFTTGYYFLGDLSDYLQDTLLGWIGLNDADFYLSGFLAKTISVLVNIIFGFLFIFIFASIGGYVIVIIMSPVLAYISEKTEKIITGNDYPFSAEQLMRDVVRGVLIALRNLFIELGFMVGLFMIGFIPILGWILSIFTPIFLFFISSYFYGFSFMDYANERRRLSVGESIKSIRKHKGIAIGNGSMFALTLIIPGIGVIISSFLSIPCAVGAVLAMHEVDELGLDNVKKIEAK